MRVCRAVAVAAVSSALVLSGVGPAIAGDADTTVGFSDLRHGCAKLDRFSVRVALHHAIRGATYKLAGYTTNYVANGSVSFVATSTGFTHRETILMSQGTLPKHRTTIYFTLYHHRKAADTQLTYNSPHRVLPHCA